MLTTVEHGDMVAACQRRFHDVAAKKDCAAKDEQIHACLA
jgi:hypothetical protein